jgi:hypothetical protein
MSHPNGTHTTGSGSPALDIAKAAKAAFQASQLVPSSERIIALEEIVRQLEAAKDDILAANREDVEVCVIYIYILLSSSSSSMLTSPCFLSFSLITHM